MTPRVLIDEGLPEDPLAAEVVLHVRRHLEDRIDSGGRSAAADLAMMFGRPRSLGGLAAWQEAAAHRRPLFAAAQIIARENGSGLVPLGRDAAHLEACRAWLIERKEEESSFSKIIALDIATLLTLSQARDAAVAGRRGPDGELRSLPVVIVGPTGTGKQLLAEAIHQIWARERKRDPKAFHSLHVAGMPPNLIYGELFGHEKGAYTDATTKRPGHVRAASGGTLFIDEIGDLPIEAQVSLLPVLQDGTLSGLGRDRTEKVDVRVIGATLRDLDAATAKGQFRADLYHRLHAGSALRLEALRGRRGPLRDVVLELLRRKQHDAKPPVSHQALEALDRREWLGNHRELDGVLDEAISAARGRTIRLAHLPSQIARAYVSLPLHERALGTLADEAADGERTAELVTSRIERLAESIRGRSRRPDETESRKVYTFLEQIHDPSPEHAATLSRAAEAAKLEDGAEDARLLVTVLQAVLAARDVPSVVRESAQAAIEVAERDRADRRARVIAALQKVDEEQPWLRMFREIVALPIFHGQAHNEVALFMQIALRLVVSISPPMLSALRARAAEGGARGVVDEIISSLPADADETPSEHRLLAHRERPGSVTTEEWKLVASSCTSWAEAAQRTGFSAKQIKKLFAEHGVVVAWGKSKREIKS